MSILYTLAKIKSGKFTPPIDDSLSHAGMKALWKAKHGRKDPKKYVVEKWKVDEEGTMDFVCFYELPNMKRFDYILEEIKS